MTHVDSPIIYSLSICSGVGMLELGVAAALAAMGYRSRVVAYVEREAFACALLGDRAEQGALDEAPVFPELARFDGRSFRGVVDLIIAGLPCQPYSVAGKQRGNDDERSFGRGDGPIAHFLRVVEEVEPALVFLENVPAWVTARDQWFRAVGERLSEMGYRIERPLFIAASDVGASHKRERMFILAHRTMEHSARAQRAGSGEQCARGQTEGFGAGSVIVANAGITRCKGGEQHDALDSRWPQEPFGSVAQLCPSALFAPRPDDREWETILAKRPGLAPTTQPGVRVLADGNTIVVDESRRDQLRAIGNGAVPLVVAVAFVALAREAGVMQRERIWFSPHCLRAKQGMLL